ncbi:MAG: hypothetical protein MSIBF_01135 [Candidatus Altiarchaeales archaeon IMC4]|nr:MAG: hypothetical protein MSIBF_01135 [Candidatus Altiarchaeales archaeon IMC4]
MLSRARAKKGRQNIAEERIEILMGLADKEALAGDLEAADRYVKQARQIGMATNTSVAAEHKRKFCKYCYRYLLPSAAKVRLNSDEHKVEKTCPYCKKVIVYPYGREIKQRRMAK